MTEKLYYADSHLYVFQAQVLECRSRDGGWVVILDKSAFFPEGGGQAGDIGELGEAVVSDTHERDGVILHYTDIPLTVGELVTGKVNEDIRFRRMQNHSGEHIVSGLIHQHFGLDNVGFHLGSEDVTVDFNGELSRDDLNYIEQLANAAVCKNIPVITWFPSTQALSKLNYRSKLELTENVRLVEIEGCDLCACCAPHVGSTGEIGIIKLLDFEKHRGGVRVHMLCGLDALDDYTRRYINTAEISVMLSAKQLETAEAVRRALDEQEALKQNLGALKRELISYKAAALPETDGNMYFFVPAADLDSLRELVNAGMEKCGGVCAGFCGADGDYKYVIGSKSCDMRKASKHINETLRGRGGGRAEMIQGSVSCNRADIESFFSCEVFEKT